MGALACKAMDTKLSKGLNPSRQSIESNLEFICSILFDSDLKIDTRSVVKELLASNHKVTIITGDSPYTAADVGKRVGICTSLHPTMILQKCTNMETGAA